MSPSSSVQTAGSTRSTSPPKRSEALRPYAGIGRRVQGKTDRTTGPRSSTAGNPETVRIRAWAKENGYEISDHDRIHQSVKDAYYAAQ